MTRSKLPVEDSTQKKAFIEAARELGCDESEGRFNAALKRVAGHKPPTDIETKLRKEKPPTKNRK